MAEEQKTESGSPSDVSQKTIVVLVILTVLISILGTWTVLSEVGKINIQEKTPTSSANVQLNILEPGQVLQTPSKPPTTTGKDILNIQ